MNSLISRVFLVQLISMGAMEMSNPFWPLHLQTLSTNKDLVAWASAGIYILPMAGVMLTASLWGRLGDRLGHKWMMIRALGGLAFTQFLLAWSSDIYLILCLRFLQGALAGFIAPAQAYCAAATDTSRHYRMFAVLQISTNVGSALGAVLGGLILDQASLYCINLLAGVMCAACAVAVWCCLPSPVEIGKPARAQCDATPRTSTDTTIDASLSLWAQWPWLAGMLVALGLLIGARMILQAPFSVYAAQVLKMDAWATGVAYGLVALGFCACAALAARWFERQSGVQVLHAQRWVTMGLLVTTLSLGWARDGWVFGAGQFLFGALIAASTPIFTALIARRAGAQNRGFVLGLAQSVSQGFAIVGIVLGGMLIGHSNLSLLYFYVAGAYALALVLIVSLGNWGVLRRVLDDNRAGS